MKLVVTMLVALATAQPAEACAWASKDREPAPLLASEPEPETDHQVGLKIFGALLVASVLARWIVFDAGRRAA